MKRKIKAWAIAKKDRPVAKIIEGLKQAVAGDFDRVTINGQTWVRIDKKSGVNEREYRERVRKAGEKQNEPGYWKQIYPDGHLPE